jgi:hypothetical protein
MARSVLCNFFMQHRASANGPQTSGPRSGKAYRGSRKRVRRLRLRGNWSVELWIFLAVMLFTLFVVVPWIVRHPPADQHQVQTGK